MRLDPAAELAGYRLMAHEVLDSTNAEALRFALDGCGRAEPLWITAHEQTAGRGRRGNAWISQPGNLYATLLLTDPAAPKDAPQVSFVAALAVHDAICGCTAGLRAKLSFKWPNDVLCAGAKVAGILIEGQSLDFGLAVAIGIGVNCRRHPLQTDFPAIDLTQAGADVSAEELFGALSGAMVRRLTQWRRGAGFSATRADWLDRAGGIGADMRVRLPDSELFGRCEGLDESGRLILRLADGSRQAIAAGEVFPLGDAQETRSLADAKTSADGAE